MSDSPRKGKHHHIPEGYTIIFEAPQRFGKSMAMVMWAWQQWRKGRNIFSNIWLNFEHQPIEFLDLKLAGGRSIYWNSLIAIDELNFFFDGRGSMSKKNVEFSAFVLQLKKQGAILAGTTHDLSSLDVRLRLHYDYLVRPVVAPAYPKVPKIIQFEVFNGPHQARLYKKMVYQCAPFLDKYDTTAVYNPFPEAPPKKGVRRLDLSNIEST